MDESQEESPKRDRQRVFFTAVDPMDNDQSMEGISVRLGQAKDRTIDQYFRTSSKDGKWCSFELAQKRGLQIYQTRSNAIVLYNSQPAICVESGMHEDFGEAFPKSLPISTVTSSFTEAEFAKWTTGST